MIEALTLFLLEWVRANGAWSVFWSVVLEQIIVPLPAPVLILSAAMVLLPSEMTAAAALVKMTLEIVMPATAATLLGSLGMYYLGLWSGRWFVERFKSYLGFSWADVVKWGGHMSRVGLATSLFAARALPIVPLSLVSLAAGVFDVPLRTFLVWTFLGVVARGYLLAYVGWRMRARALRWLEGMGTVEGVVSFMVTAAVLGVFYWLWRRSRKSG